MATLDKKSRKIAGDQLYQISRTRYPYIPIDEIDTALRACGYKMVDEAGDDFSAIFCGIQGHCTIQVATMEGDLVNNSLVALQWYKGTPDQKNFEINCYLS